MSPDSHEPSEEEVTLMEKLAQRNLSIKGVENPTSNDVQEVVSTIREAVSTAGNNQLRINILKETLRESLPLFEGNEVEYLKRDGMLEESLRIKANIGQIALRESQHKPEFTSEQKKTIQEVLAVLRKLKSFNIATFANVTGALGGLSVASVYASKDDDILSEEGDDEELDFTFMEAKRLVAKLCPCLGISIDSRVEDIDEALIVEVLTKIEGSNEPLEDDVLKNMN